MAKGSKTWAFSSRGPSLTKIPDALKAALSAKAQHLIDAELKPAHIKPPQQSLAQEELIDTSPKRRILP